MIKLFNWKS